jgi:hypothetical protein
MGLIDIIDIIDMYLFESATAKAGWCRCTVYVSVLEVNQEKALSL